ncbi:MAG: pectin esterase [Chitinophagaceae bacterium]|nr:pectin esterase [Chitinophagaceae bacterium]
MKNLLILLFCFISIDSLTAQPNKIIVAQDGSGNYKTVQQALNSISLKNAKPVIIFIRKGFYKEKLHLDSTKNNVTLIGEDKFKTILSYDDHTGKLSPSGDTINTRTSASFLVKANNFKAENLTFQNDAGFSARQAVGLEIQGDKAIIINCRIIGNQDILFTNTDMGRQCFEDCYIEGTTDFIFGSSSAWFDHCHIHSKKNSHITAASTPPEHAYGYVFNDCIFTADSSLRNVSLGRPWRPYGSVTYIHCYMDKQIKPEGWSNWNTTDYFKTARFAEYESYGPGAGKEGRVQWARQLTGEEVKKITKKSVLRNWNPG